VSDTQGQTPGQGQGQGQGKTDRLGVLIVDDIEENLIAMRALLSRDDVEVHEARSGPEALEILLVTDIALAILDVQMPEMDGIELAQLMRGSARTQKVPIIFVTASSASYGARFDGYEVGAVDFLLKPIDGRVLRGKVSVFLELHRQRKLLEAQLKTNELVVAAIGHDLRNPLNAMMMGVELLRTSSLEESQQRILARLASAGTRMVRLIDDLYDVTRSRLGSGIEIERKDGVDLTAVLRAQVAEVQSTGARQPIVLRHIDECLGRFDPDELARVFSNLISNAVRHGDASRPVAIDLRLGQREVTIEIENGGQIAPHILPYVWDPFMSGAPAHQRTSLGLGLYVVRAIVEAHGGSASVDSKDGRTLFRVSLPLA
jgi:two-component system sensor histidine kinase/response regulator